VIATAIVAGWLSLTTAIDSRATTSADTGIDATTALVDLNAADVRTLCTLPGIGPKKAEGIVALRDQRPLTRVTQLLQVRGIGPRILERLRGRVTLRPPPAPPPDDPARRPGAQAELALRGGAAPRP
jgi:competence ComEA-like helix-hairpin-helix protein